MEKIFGGKIFYAFIVGGIIVGLSFFLSRPFTPKSPKSSGGSGIVTEKTIALNDELNKDSDHDGVADWEEALWGTDPNNPDTYGHGLGDRGEIEKKRTTITASGTDSAAGPETQTTLFGKQLYTTLATLKQSGELNEGAIKNLSSEISKNLDSQSKTKVYVLSDLKTVPTNNSTLEAYRLNIIRLISKHEKDPLGTEVSAIADAITESDPEKLKTLEKNVPLYRQAAKEYLAVPVPNILVDSHLAIVNAYEGVAAALERMGAVLDDPLLGLIEIKRYRDSTDRLVSALFRIARYYSLRGTISTNTP